MLSKELIKFMRVLVGYTQEELSQAVNREGTYINKVELGKLAPPQIVQLNIVKACKDAGMTDIQFALMKVLTEEGSVKND